MRELILVLGICLVITLGIGVTITFWEIPAPINQKSNCYAYAQSYNKQYT